MKIDLGKPYHGWVDLTLEDHDFILADSIADVPDFIENLAIALTNLFAEDKERHVDLSLEPGYYVLTLERNQTDFSVTIDIAETVNNLRLPHKIVGGFEDVILPIFQAIQDFYSNQYSEPHWPEGNIPTLQTLAQTIEAHRP